MAQPLLSPWAGLYAARLQTQGSFFFVLLIVGTVVAPSVTQEGSRDGVIAATQSGHTAKRPTPNLHSVEHGGHALGTPLGPQPCTPMSSTKETTEGLL